MIQAGHLIVSIYTEQTPNPETMKFVVNKLLYPGKSAEFSNIESTTASPLARALFDFPFVTNVFIASNFVTLTRATADIAWLDIIPTIKQFLKEYIEQNKQIIIEEELIKIKKANASTISIDNVDVVEKIKQLLENYVKPAVEMDGGAIEFKNFENGVVTVSLQGSCSGCPSSTVTLKAGIEGMMKRMIPEVQEVIAEGEEPMSHNELEEKKEED